MSSAVEKKEHVLPQLDEVLALVKEKMEVVTSTSKRGEVKERMILRQIDVDKIRKRFGVDLAAQKHSIAVDSLISTASGQCVLGRLTTKLEDAKKNNVPVEERRKLRVEGKVAFGGIGSERLKALAFRERAGSNGEKIETFGRLYGKISKPFKGSLATDYLASESEKIKKLAS